MCRLMTGSVGYMGEQPSLESKTEQSRLVSRPLSIVEFAARRYAVAESDGHVRLKVHSHNIRFLIYESYIIA